MKFNGIKRFRSLGISRRDLVVEVGSGSEPYWRSDVLVDKYVSDSAERPGEHALLIDRPFIVGDALNLPLQNESVDFVISRNLLEHLASAEKFLEELTRVGRRGYLTMPSVLSEKLFGWTKHIWFISVEQGALRLRAKERPLYDPHLSGIFHSLYARDRAFRQFYQRNRALFVEEYYWEGRIDYQIEGDLRHLDQLKTTQARFDIESLRSVLENRSQIRMVNRLHSFGRRIASRVGVSQTLDILERLACPVCTGELTLVDQVLICSSCSEHYPLVAQVPVLVVEVADQNV